MTHHGRVDNIQVKHELRTSLFSEHGVRDLGPLESKKVKRPDGAKLCGKCTSVLRSSNDTGFCSLCLQEAAGQFPGETEQKLVRRLRKNLRK